MKAIRTVKLKVSGSLKVEGLLAVWLKAANWLSQIVFKTEDLNSNRLAKAYYATLRQMGLSSQLACSLCKTVAATYKTAKTNKRWKRALFTHPVMPIVWKRDFNRSTKGVTLWGEKLTITDSRPLPEGPWKDSKLKRVKGQWYLILSYEIEVPEPKSQGCIVGVDKGIKRLIVATNSANSKTFFLKGGVLNHRRSCIRRTRAAFSSVGTRSARRLLRRLSGNEKAVTGHLLHVASKALVVYSLEVGAVRIVVEDLENIRDSSLSKGKDLRSKIHRWPYAEARFKIGYKAAAVGIALELVDPRHTSQGCNCCGYVLASNRKGLHFHCKNCGHQEDADRNASKNIRGRSVFAGYIPTETGSFKAPQSSVPFEINTGSCVPHGDSVFGVGAG